MTASLRERKTQATREALRLAAEALFEEKGYGNTTMTAIAARAGVSRATVFNYYPSKDHLLKEMALDHLRTVNGQIAPTLEGQSAYEQLWQLMEALLDATWPHLVLTRYLLVAALAQPEISHDVLWEMIDMIVPIITVGQGDGSFRQDMDVTLIARLVVGVYLANVFPWPEERTPQAPVSFESMRDLVYEGIVPGVQR